MEGTGEGRSQSDIRMKGLQEKLLKEVCKVNDRVVLVLINGRVIDITNVADDVEAVLVTWYLGTESGLAFADVLSGRYYPYGKLPLSFPRNVGQMCFYYYDSSTGRPSNPSGVYCSNYLDVDNSPLFPFGF